MSSKGGFGRALRVFFTGYRHDEILAEVHPQAYQPYPQGYPPPSPAGAVTAGEIWLADVALPDGTGLARRPCLILSVGPAGILAAMVISTSQDRSGIPSSVPLPRDTWNRHEPAPSYADLDDRRWLPPFSLVTLLGRCPYYAWSQVERLMR